MKNKLRSLHKERMKLLCEAHKNVVRLEANINYTTNRQDPNDVLQPCVVWYN